MAVARCKNGHYYDGDQFQQCPYCGETDGSLSQQVIDAQSGGDDSGNIRNMVTVFDPIGNERELAKQLTQHFLENELNREEEEDDEGGKTIGIHFDGKEAPPVVGWLVCESGPERGNSYTLTAGRNFIGRSYKSDIVIYDDGLISRENHCSVIFEPKTCDFYIMPSENAVTSLNGNVLKDATVITDEDSFVIGGTTLRMIPYCKKGREWN